MTPYTEAYYMHGKSEALSNYENYGWLADSTLAWAHAFRRLLDIPDGARILDAGAARGFYVKALRMIGMEAYGYDISEWAVTNCDPDVKPYMSNHINGARFDLTFSKDCFEHIPPMELENLIKRLLLFTERLFIIVPLSFERDGAYVHSKEENDKTHVNRWPLQDWISFMGQVSTSFITSGSYMYPGLKPGAYEVDRGYGFILCTKI